MAVKRKSAPTTQITFEGTRLKGKAVTLTLTGLASENINRPEKIRKLMDLLELPTGTNARIVYAGDDVIVR